MDELIIASKNVGKINEFTQLLGGKGITLQSFHDLTEPIPSIVESGTTFAENALVKAKTIAEFVQKPVIADDSGLVVDALDGKPGVYSARYAGEPTNDEKNYRKLLHDLHGVPESKRTAR